MSNSPYLGSLIVPRPCTKGSHGLTGLNSTLMKVRCQMETGVNGDMQGSALACSAVSHVALYNTMIWYSTALNFH